jgi:predicted NUDIX family NTP pyrophosphohydrolase
MRSVSRVEKTEDKMLAKLTKAEDAFWVRVFSDAINNGKSESAADTEAWVAAKREFPRLAKYDGCKP